jgi:hypothetical protein
VPYLEGALARAKAWSIRSSPYDHHSPAYREWMRGYADYPQKTSVIDTLMDVLKTISVSDWKTSGELRKMARDAHSSAKNQRH